MCSTEYCYVKAGDGKMILCKEADFDTTKI